jgi:hypothetical protein
MAIMSTLPRHLIFWDIFRAPQLPKGLKTWRSPSPGLNRTRFGSGPVLASTFRCAPDIDLQPLARTV